MVKVGQRVGVKSIKAKGRIEYIDQPYLFHNYMYPIQVRLDKRYTKATGGSNDYMYRTSLNDLVWKGGDDFVRSDATRPPASSRGDRLLAYKQEIDQFLRWINKRK